MSHSSNYQRGFIDQATLDTVYPIDQDQATNELDNLDIVLHELIIESDRDHVPFYTEDLI